MTQIEIKDDLLTKDCSIYEQRVKDDGIYYYMRRNGTKKMVVVYPTKDSRPYTKPAICHIYETLGIESLPENMGDFCQSFKKEKSKAATLSEFPKRMAN